MYAISAGINERKKIFILVVVGVVDTNFDVSKEDRAVREFPDFLFCLLVSVIRRFLQGVKEATVEDVVGEDNVGNKHIKMNNYKLGRYLGVIRLHQRHIPLLRPSLLHLVRHPAPPLRLEYPLLLFQFLVHHQFLLPPLPPSSF